MPWPLTEPLIVDRAAERRDLDMADATAIVVRDGAVLAAGGVIVELPPGERPDAALTVYLGRDGERDLVAVVPADERFGLADDGIGSERMVGLQGPDRTPLPSAGPSAARDRELAVHRCRDHHVARQSPALLTVWRADDSHQRRVGAPLPCG